MDKYILSLSGTLNKTPLKDHATYIIQHAYQIAVIIPFVHVHSKMDKSIIFLSEDLAKIAQHTSLIVPIKLLF